MNWKEKGRAFADSCSWGWAGRARVLLATPAADIESRIRGDHADLLAAVRWAAALILPTHNAETWADTAEAEALRLLTEGFRERLTEIAESSVEHQRGNQEGGRAGDEPPRS